MVSIRKMSSESNHGLNSDNQETQLLQAAFYGSLDLVKSLLTADNLNVRDAIGRTPLTLACWNGHYAVAEHLLTAGADFAGAFRQATTSKRSRIVELLLEHGADVNEEYTDGQRPIHHASERGNVQVAEVLLKFGADVNARDCYGKAPLHYAAAQGNLPLTELLLKHHADVNITNNVLQTPLQMSSSLPVVRLLLENGADVNTIDLSDFNNPKKLDILTILLDYGCGSQLCHTPNCCEGKLSVISCEYSKLTARAKSDEGLKLNPLFQVYERHHVKVSVLLDENSLTEHTPFTAKCTSELQRIKNSSATYHILKQDLPSLLNHSVLEVTPERCRERFPIYGDMIYSNFLQIRRQLLLEQCSGLFSMTDLPRLPPECVTHVLRYLSDEDLSNSAELCLSG